MIASARHIFNLISIVGLNKEDRSLVFYSEGKNYWVHLKGLIGSILNESDQRVCYLTSSDDDPGLRLKHHNYKAFEIGDRYCRDWLFANIDTDVMVMTTPDLHQFQVKKSCHAVHYVYVQHSLVSLHMVYRPKAFEHYQTIFCAGPHHLREMRAIEAHNGYAQKNLIEHGYTRLDDILLNASTPPTAESANALGVPQPIHVLIAPSWGQFGTIESGLAFNIIDDLLARGFQVTLRPHPQTSRFHGYEISRIRDKFNSQALFFLEDNVAGQESLHASDLMVGDWSGAALDYAFGLKKPVIFIDIPKKVNDPDYIKIDLEPIEIGVRQEIGVVVSPACQSLPIEECLETDINALDISRYVYNVGRSGSVGANAILKLLQCETR